MNRGVYFKQARLLLRILPLINKYDSLALKGGTAINFFIRKLPRLSIDIDLTYLPIEDRDSSLAEISRIMLLLSDDIKYHFFESTVIPKMLDGDVVKGLVIRHDGVTIKIGPNLVMRGSVFNPIVMSTSFFVEKEFEISAQMKVLSLEDLYGGKICAALDRQHPRDLFDIKLLFENEGFTEKIKQSFIVYLLAHPRPIVEILAPRLLNLQELFTKEFVGMSRIDTSLSELLESRDKLFSVVKSSLTERDKEFLISVKKGEPHWELCEVPHIKELPAIKWKLHNIKKMNRQKNLIALKKLATFLDRTDSHD